jgi:ammonia channel protein AmtB
MNYETGKIANYDMVVQMVSQFKAVGMTLAWSGIGAAVILVVINMVIGLRLPAEEQDALAAALLSMTDGDAADFPIDDVTRAGARRPWTGGSD